MARARRQRAARGSRPKPQTGYKAPPADDATPPTLGQPSGRNAFAPPYRPANISVNGQLLPNDPPPRVSNPSAIPPAVSVNGQLLPDQPPDTSAGPTSASIGPDQQAGYARGGAVGGNMDRKASILAGLRKRYDAHIGMAQGAMAHGDLNAAMHLASKAHDQVPDGHDLSFQGTPEGNVQATARHARSGVTSTHAMTPQQFHHYLVGPATSFDHVIDNGVHKNLGIASGKGAISPPVSPDDPIHHVRQVLQHTRQMHGLHRIGQPAPRTGYQEGGEVTPAGYAPTDAELAALPDYERAAPEPESAEPSGPDPGIVEAAMQHAIFKKPKRSEAGAARDMILSSYARGGPVRRGYQEGGEVPYDEDPAQYAPPQVYPDTGYGADPAQYAPEPSSVPVDAGPPAAAQDDPEFAQRLADRARRRNLPRQPAPDEPVTAESELKPLLRAAGGKLLERGAEAVGSAVAPIGAAARSAVGAVSDAYGATKQALADYVNGTIAPPAAETERVVQAAEGATPGEKALNAVLNPAPAAAAELPAAARTTGYAAAPAGELSPDYLSAAGGQALAGQAPAGAGGTYIGPQGEERTGPNTAVQPPRARQPGDTASLEELNAPYAPAAAGQWPPVVKTPTQRATEKAWDDYQRGFQRNSYDPTDHPGYHDPAQLPKPVLTGPPGSQFGVPRDPRSPLVRQELDNASRVPDRDIMRNADLLQYLPPGYFDTAGGRAAIERIARTSSYSGTEGTNDSLAGELLRLYNPANPEQHRQAPEESGYQIQQAPSRANIPPNPPPGEPGHRMGVRTGSTEAEASEYGEHEFHPYSRTISEGGGGRRRGGGSRGSPEAAESRGSGGGGGGRAPRAPRGRRSELDEDQIPATTGYNQPVRYAAADTGTMTDAGPDVLPATARPAQYTAPAAGGFTPGPAGGATNTILPTRPGSTQGAPAPAAASAASPPLPQMTQAQIDATNANRQEYYRRLRAGEPTGIDAGYGRGVDTAGTYDFTRPLPPRQAPNAQSMAERDEAVRQGIIHAPPPAAPMTAVQQKALEASSKAQTEVQRQLFETYRKTMDTGGTLSPAEREAYQLLLQKYGVRGPPTAAAPAGGAAPSAGITKTINGVTYRNDGRGWIAQ